MRSRWLSVASLLALANWWPAAPVLAQEVVPKVEIVVAGEVTAVGWGGDILPPVGLSDAEADDLTPTPDGTIVLGEPVGANQYPGTVKISFAAAPTRASVWDERGACTGTLVSPRHVLTAYHCYFDDDGVAKPYVRYGLRAFGGLDRYERRLIIGQGVTGAVWPRDKARNLEPAYRAADGSIRYWRHLDMILVRLPEDVEGADQRVVPIATAADLASYRGPVLVGWGHTEATPSTMTLNRLSRLRIAADAYGQATIDISTPVKEGSVTRAAGVCGGDSGGPLYLMRTTTNLIDGRLLGVIHAFEPPTPEPPARFPPGWSDLSYIEQCSYAGNQSVAVNLLLQTEYLRLAFDALP